MEYLGPESMFLRSSSIRKLAMDSGRAKDLRSEAQNLSIDLGLGNTTKTMFMTVGSP